MPMSTMPDQITRGRPAAAGPIRRWLLTAAAVVLALPTLLLAGDYDRWYAVEMGGQRAGWMHSTQKTINDKITTGSTVTMTVGRGQASVTISMSGEFVETTDGKPVSLKTVTTMGKVPTTMECTFGPTEMAIKLDQAGRTTQMTRPLPEGAWLTPAAAESFVRQRLAAKTDRIVFRTIAPAGGLDPISLLTPATMTHRDCRPETIRIMGKDVPAIRCITTSSTQPGVESIDFMDENGLSLRSETKLGAIEMNTIAVDRAEAMADRPGPELMVATFVKPDRPIKRPRRTTQAQYLLSIADGDFPALPTTGAQRVQATGPRSATVRLDLKALQPAPEADSKDPAFLAASATIDSSDAEIKKLAAMATQQAGDAKPERAEAMRRFVHTFIRSKDLGVGFASASEVARSREGDCTEHGVLLAALLRADGIPSRVVCGLIYADAFAGAKNIFGYHMWAQALLDVGGKPTWVDLDGTLDEETPFDATHIALAASALADGDTQNALIALATIIGRLDIKIESVE